MKKFLYVILVLATSIYLFGCGKKQQVAEEGISMEALTAVGPETKATVETKSITEVKSAGEAKVVSETKPITKVKSEVTSAPTAELKLEPLPPAGPYKPTDKEIQTALSNAGFYTGPIDGVIGKKTKKAIEDFQKANGLQVDGKVGPKTWAVLGKYLTSSSAATTAPKKKVPNP